MQDINLNYISSLIISCPVPQLFLGAPGIGKSEIIRATAISLAREKNKTFIDLAEASSEQIKSIIQNPEKYYVFYRIVASQITPEDIRVPKLSDHFFDSLAPLRIYILSLKGIEGVLFIDEITNIQREDVMTMMFALIQERQLGDIYIQPTIKIVLAGNRSEHSASARPLPNPILSRVLIFNVTAPTIRDWIEYMNTKYGDNWDKRIAAYLHAFSSDFIKIPEEPEGFDAYPTPRSWTNLAITLAKFNSNIIPRELLHSICVGALGPDVGTKVYSFIVQQPPSFEELLNNPRIINTLNLEQKVLAIYSLASNVQKLMQTKYKTKAAKLLQWLLDNEKELLSLLIIMIPRKDRSKFIRSFFTIFAKFADELVKLYQ